MSQWRDFEFKAMLSELSTTEQTETLAAVIKRWLKRPASRQWKLDYIAPLVWLVG